MRYLATPSRMITNTATKAAQPIPAFAPVLMDALGSVAAARRAEVLILPGRVVVAVAAGAGVLVLPVRVAVATADGTRGLWLPKLVTVPG